MVAAGLRSKKMGLDTSSTFSNSTHLQPKIDFKCFFVKVPIVVHPSSPALGRNWTNGEVFETLKLELASFFFGKIGPGLNFLK